MNKILFNGFYEQENGKKTITINGRQYYGEWIVSDSILRIGDKIQLWLEREGWVYVIPETVSADEIARLTAENDKLRARLENVVELKAEVGDIIYMPWEYDGESDVATLKIEKIEWRDGGFAYITDFTSDIYSYLAKYNYGIFYAIDFDYKVYTDRAEAEAKLKELQGGDAE